MPQKPYIIWSLDPKALKYESFKPWGSFNLLEPAFCRGGFCRVLIRVSLGCIRASWTTTACVILRPLIYKKFILVHTKNL